MVKGHSLWLQAALALENGPDDWSGGAVPCRTKSKHNAGVFYHISDGLKKNLQWFESFIWLLSNKKRTQVAYIRMQMHQDTPLPGVADHLANIDVY